MRWAILLCALLALYAATPAAALYEETDDVVQPTDATFASTVLKSKGVWIVEFYAPWCGHCKALAPEWKKAATALKGIAGVAAVDAEKYRALGGKFGVEGFPTIKIFGANKKQPVDYNGGRRADEIVEAVLKTVKQTADARLGKKAAEAPVTKDGALVELTDAAMEDVMGGSEPWLLEFYAPWCGHCKRLAPEYKKAAGLLEADGVKVGAVDATKHQKFNSKFNVQGFPTIVMLPKGGKGPVVPFEGGRTADALAAFAREQAKK